MLKRHNVAVFIYCGYFQFRWKSIFGYDPAVVTSYFQFFRQALENIVMLRISFHHFDRGSNTMIYTCEVIQFAAKSFANGLVPQANAKN
jgi:hypothetical protein